MGARDNYFIAPVLFIALLLLLLFYVILFLMLNSVGKYLAAKYFQRTSHSC